jgi:hypothetical protein
MTKTKTNEMSERQAARMIEMYENAMRNGEQWAHDVLLHRGTPKYEQSLEKLNEAFGIKAMQTVVKPVKFPAKPLSRNTAVRPQFKSKAK